MTKALFRFIRDLYQTNDYIPLHAPCFQGNESQYVQQTIDSTFVSSVGEFVNRFEHQMAAYCGAASAVAVVNGTAGLHAALYACGVKSGDLVITQSFTFVATCNAIHWVGAEPVFVDIDAMSLSLSASALQDFLENHCVLTPLGCFHKASKRRISAVVPMHTFGHPADLDALLTLCQTWQIMLIEDAAESLGSLYKAKHTGTFGQFGVFSFNGNKIITTGGGGMVLCADPTQGQHLKHLTTTAKLPHSFEFEHDEYGFNYRMPNLNAALGCGQMEQLDTFIANKRYTANLYAEYFAASDYQFVTEPHYARSNYWLNAVICPSETAKQQLLAASLSASIMLRPAWKPMHTLSMYQHCIKQALPVTELISSRLVNLPSSIRNSNV